MTDKKDRYKNIPISEETRKGMTLTSDDLHAITRALSIQDNAYDEQFEEIHKTLAYQKEAYLTIIEGMKEVNQSILALQDDIRDIKKDVYNLKQDVGKVTKTVDCTRNELEDLASEVKKLKTINSMPMLALRIAVGVIIGLLVAWAFHGPI